MIKPTRLVSMPVTTYLVSTFSYNRDRKIEEWVVDGQSRYYPAFQIGGRWIYYRRPSDGAVIWYFSKENVVLFFRGEIKVL